MKYSTAKEVLEQFGLAVEKNHGAYSYAYLTGYFQNALAGVMSQLSEEEFQRELDSFKRETKRIEQEAIFKMLGEKE